MPTVRIEMLEGKTKTQKEALINSLFKAFEENGIPKEWVNITICDLPLENWGVNGQLLREKINGKKN